MSSIEFTLKERDISFSFNESRSTDFSLKERDLSFRLEDREDLGMSDREFAEGQREQSPNESIIYTLDVSEWGNSPGSISAKAYLIGADGSLTDQTDTVMPGSPSVSDNVISFPALGSLTDKSNYKLEIKFTIGSQTFEAYGFVACRR